MSKKAYKILIDARSMRIDRNGPSRYAKNVLRNLAKIDETDEFTVIVNRDYVGFIDKSNFRIIHTDIKPYGIMEHWQLPLMFRRERYDLFHSMQYLPPLGMRYPSIMTLYDALHADPKFWGESVYKKMVGKYARVVFAYAMRRSLGIITISRYSASQITKFFNYDVNRIFPIYLGVDRLYIKRNHARDFDYSSRKWKIPCKYILSISNMKAYKNVDVLIKAFAQIIKSGRNDLCLVLAGKINDTDMNSRMEVIHSLGIYDRTYFLRNLCDEDLAALLGGSHIFVFPSKIEGFGLPLLEAMAAGVPCIASDIEVFHEVCGDAVAYFHLDDINGLKDRIQELLLSDKIRERISVRGVARAETFTWENTAKETLAVYKSIIKEAHHMLG